MSLGLATPAPAPSSTAGTSGPTSGPRAERPGVLGSSSPQLSSRPPLPPPSSSPSSSGARPQGSAGSAGRPQGSAGSALQSSGSSASGQVHAVSMTENSGRASKRPHTANSGAEPRGAGAEDGGSFHLLGGSVQGKGCGSRCRGAAVSGAPLAAAARGGLEHGGEREAGTRGGAGLASLRQTLSGLQHTLSGARGAGRPPRCPRRAGGRRGLQRPLHPQQECLQLVQHAPVGGAGGRVARRRRRIRGLRPLGARRGGLAQGRSSLGRGSRGGGGTENSDDGSVAAAYSLLLKSELLGLGAGPSSGGGGSARVPAPAMLASAAQGEAGYPG